jgi:hypothetical protein
MKLLDVYPDFKDLFKFHLFIFASQTWQYTIKPAGYTI